MSPLVPQAQYGKDHLMCIHLHNARARHYKNATFSELCLKMIHIPPVLGVTLDRTLINEKYPEKTSLIDNEERLVNEAG